MDDRLTGILFFTPGSVGDSMSTTSSSHEIRTRSTSSGSGSYHLSSHLRHQSGATSANMSSGGSGSRKVGKSPVRPGSVGSSPGRRGYQREQEFSETRWGCLFGYCIIVIYCYLYYYWYLRNIKFINCYPFFLDFPKKCHIKCSSSIDQGIFLYIIHCSCIIVSLTGITHVFMADELLLRIIHHIVV